MNHAHALSRHHTNAKLAVYPKRSGNKERDRDRDMIGYWLCVLIRKSTITVVTQQATGSLASCTRTWTECEYILTVTFSMHSKRLHQSTRIKLASRTNPVKTKREKCHEIAWTVNGCHKYVILNSNLEFNWRTTTKIRSADANPYFR